MSQEPVNMQFDKDRGKALLKLLLVLLLNQATLAAFL